MDTESLRPYTAHGRPNGVKGVIGGAIHFDGTRQYVNLGDLHTCFTTECTEGFMFTLWAKIEDLTRDEYFISGPYYSLFQKNGRLYATVHAGGRKWEVSSANIQQDTWHLIDVSWHPATGR